MCSIRSCQRPVRVRRSFSISLPASARMNVKRDRRDRPRHRRRRVGDQDARTRHRGNVDRVVTDAVSRDDAQPAIGACDGGRRRARRVDVDGVVTRGMLRRELVDDLRQILPLDVLRVVEDRERGPAERRLAARVENVARDADAEGFGSLRESPIYCRRTSRPWRSALCSIAWSTPYANSRKP